jgi:N-acetylglucosamine-6-phosphate deacetylase
MKQSTLIQNALLALDDTLIPGDLLIRDGRIASLSGTGNSGAAGEGLRPDRNTVVVSAEGRILAPGFIDLHCHGGAGADVNDGDRERFFIMEEFHRRHGITSFMPSLSVDPMEKLERSCAMVRSLIREEPFFRAEILGLHFESPYINPRYKGCQAAERLLPFDEEAMGFIERNGDVIARITVAPELPGVMDAIPRIREMGIVVSGGHSGADAATVRDAADRGMTMATHLFNAMSSVHKEGPFRVPGFLEAALTDDRIYTECIADGYHVPAELLRIAWRCKGPDRFMLCSDASRAAGYTGTEPLFICGQEAVVEQGIAMVKDRSSLASSAVALDTMVRFLVEKARFSVPEALRAASLVPAMAAGAASRKGRLAPGYDADLVLLDKELQVAAVWCRGVRSGP